MYARFFFFKQKTAYDMRISDWSSDVFSSDLRGFSFQADGPLDMRMEADGPSAADFVNNADETMIADVLFALGEEPKARRIARAIVQARPIERTSELAAIVRRATGYRPRSEEHTSELQSLMRISYAVFCLKKKTRKDITIHTSTQISQKTETT